MGKSRTGATRQIAIAFVVAVALASGCSSPSYPTATFQCCRGEILARQRVVSALRKKCPKTSGHVTLDLALSSVRRTFECSTMRASEESAEAALAASVMHVHDAAGRAGRMIRFWRSLGVRAEDTQAGLTWDLGTTVSDWNCDHTTDVAFRRTEIADAKSVGENASHWLRVEAGWVAGACPDRLQSLYQTVIAAGEPEAVRAVRHELAILS